MIISGHTTSLPQHLPCLQKRKIVSMTLIVTMATSFHSAMLSHYNPRFASLLRKYPGEDFGDGYE